MGPDAERFTSGSSPQPDGGGPVAPGSGRPAPGLPEVLDAFGDGLVLVDCRGRPRILRTGPVAGMAAGEGPVRLIALWRTLFPERGRALEALEGLEAVLAAKQDVYRTRTWPEPDRPVDVAISPLPVTAAGGRAAGALLRTSIPPSLSVEDRARYRELFEASPDLYLTLDRRGRIEAVNRRALLVLGYPSSDLIGARPIRFLTAESRRRLRAALPSLLATGVLENLELEVLRSDGRPLYGMVNALAVRDSTGSWAGARIVLRDVTQRTLLQRQLRQTDRLAATGRLAAGIAHEINNPLQAVLTHLEVVEATLPRPFAAADSWARVEEGLGRIREIVEDLLDLHRGRGLEHGPVDVHRVIDETLGLVRTQLRQRRITVTVRRAEHLPPVSATVRHVYQIVLNLVLNAVDALSQGGELTVTTRHVSAAREVEVDVADSGPGISEEMLPRLFDPFRSNSAQTGTGLGLFVTYGLVREYRGRIRVDSRPGRGTRFTFALPAWEGGDSGTSAGSHEPDTP
jgi:PAS domain S-box-containing protein